MDDQLIDYTDGVADDITVDASIVVVLSELVPIRSWLTQNFIISMGLRCQYLLILTLSVIQSSGRRIHFVPM